MAKSKKEFNKEAMYRKIMPSILNKTEESQEDNEAQPKVEEAKEKKVHDKKASEGKKVNNHLSNIGSKLLKDIQEINETVNEEDEKPVEKQDNNDGNIIYYIGKKDDIHINIRKKSSDTDSNEEQNGENTNNSDEIHIVLKQEKQEDTKQEIVPKEKAPVKDKQEEVNDNKDTKGILEQEKIGEQDKNSDENLQVEEVIENEDNTVVETEKEEDENSDVDGGLTIEDNIVEDNNIIDNNKINETAVQEDNTIETPNVTDDIIENNDLVDNNEQEIKKQYSDKEIENLENEDNQVDEEDLNTVVKINVYEMLVLEKIDVVLSRFRLANSNITRQDIIDKVLEKCPSIEFEGTQLEIYKELDKYRAQNKVDIVKEIIKIIFEIKRNS